jgi:hypothetical protein
VRQVAPLSASFASAPFAITLRCQDQRRGSVRGPLVDVWPHAPEQNPLVHQAGVSDLGGICQRGRRDRAERWRARATEASVRGGLRARRARL